MTLLLATLTFSFFYFGFMRRRDERTIPLRIGFGVVLILTLVSGFLGIGRRQAVVSLATLVSPVPEAEDVVYLPQEQLMEAYREAFEAGRGGTASSLPQSVAAQFAHEEAAAWIAHSSLTGDGVVRFYEERADLDDWLPSRQSENWLLLQRDEERMSITWREDENGVYVLYLYTPNP